VIYSSLYKGNTMKKKTKPPFRRRVFLPRTGMTLQAVRQSWQRLRHAALALSLGVMAAPAMAGLPSVEPPSSGGGGGLQDTIKGYVQDGIILGGLVIAAIAFIVVANSAIATFSEVRDGKSTWMKFASIIVVGVILLVAVIWLVGKSAEVLT
jgi:integrating conjugative element membrane protein (TIGR03745 family)